MNSPPKIRTGLENLEVIYISGVGLFFNFSEGYPLEELHLLGGPGTF